MLKLFKYKMMNIFSDKFFLLLLGVYFLILNYTIFINSGILYIGSSSYNAVLKYTLLINNFTLTSSIFGLILSVYIGSGLIGKDISSGQIYVMLSTYPKKWKYLIGNWFGLIGSLLIVIILMLINYFAITLALDVKIVFSDLLFTFRDIFLNMAVILTITSVASIVLKGFKSFIVGLAGIVLFNLYSAQILPIINTQIMLSDTTRRLFANICPIAFSCAPSINNLGELTQYMVSPLLISNLTAYQIIYIGVILLLGIFMFNNIEI